MLIRVELITIMEDEIFGTPILVLKEVDGIRWMPIWVGPFEGQAIEYGIHGSQLSRPLPYDTYLHTIKKLGASIKKIYIRALINNTYYATMELEEGGGITEIDSRPSDAIAIAVRCGAPIYIKEALLMDASMNNVKKNIEKNLNLDNDEIKKWINKINPSDF